MNSTQFPSFLLLKINNNTILIIETLMWIFGEIEPNGEAVLPCMGCPGPDCQQHVQLYFVPKKHSGQSDFIFYEASQDLLNDLLHEWALQGLQA